MGLLKPRQNQSLIDYPWSSAASGYARPPRQRAPWLAAADGLAAFGLPDTTSGRRKFIEHLDHRAREEARERCGLPPEPADRRQSHLRRGWYWGSQAFAENLLALAAKAIPTLTYRSAPLHQTHNHTRAETIIREGLAAAGLREDDLPRLPGNDPRKVRIALAAWGATNIAQSNLAERLHMRSAANVSQILRRARTRSAVKIC